MWNFLYLTGGWLWRQLAPGIGVGLLLGATGGAAVYPQWLLTLASYLLAGLGGLWALSWLLAEAERLDREG